MKKPKVLKKAGQAAGSPDETRILKYVIAAAIVIGIVVAAFILLVAGSQSYSALYIESYSNYVEDGTVSFTYGVDKFGPATASYMFKVFMGEETMHSEDFVLKQGTRKNSVSFPVDLEDYELPVKVRLVLREEQEGGGVAAYETYFWLRGAK